MEEIEADTKKWKDIPALRLEELLLLLLSHFSRVRLCATPSLGFSRQEHWSGLPFPSPMHKSEKWKWSRSLMSDSSQPHGLQPTGSSVHGIFQARVLEWGAIAFSVEELTLYKWSYYPKAIYIFNVISIKKLWYFSQIILKFTWKHNWPWIAKANLGEKNKAGVIRLTDFRLWYKASVTKWTRR